MRLPSALKRYSAMAVLLVGLLLACNVPAANADNHSIWIVSSEVTNLFPGGFQFSIEAMAENDIRSIMVRLQIGQDARGATGRMFLDRGRSVRGEMIFDLPGLVPGDDNDPTELERTGVVQQMVDEGSALDRQ